MDMVVIDRGRVEGRVSFGYTMLKHKKTGVCYIVTQDPHGVTITPLYNADGSLYKE